MRKVYFLKFIVLLLITSCTNSSSQENTSINIKKSYINDYETINLDYELKEISGITFINDSLIAAVEDENGIIYFFDLSQKKVIRKLTFSEPDDFEDLIKVKNDIYVVNSKGNIYHIQSFQDSVPTVDQYKTEFTGKNDIESLTYNRNGNTLLLSVKGKNLNGDKDDKSIYSFSLSTKKLNSTPFINILHKDLEALFKGDEIEEASKEFLKKIGNQNLNKVFTPTALAFHPVTNDLYVLSSTNNLILVFTNKKLKQVISLQGREFSQAEGMSFNSNAELYISNEGGKNTTGNILKINQINDK